MNINLTDITVINDFVKPALRIFTEIKFYRIPINFEGTLNFVDSPIGFVKEYNKGYHNFELSSEIDNKHKFRC